MAVTFAKGLSTLQHATYSSCAQGTNFFFCFLPYVYSIPSFVKTKNSLSHLYALIDFPLDCFQLIEDCGYRIMTYQQMKQTNIQLYEYCRLLSDDAFHFKPKKLVAYNEDQSFYRIRFSLMHELGHILLNHEGDRRENEQEQTILPVTFWHLVWQSTMQILKMQENFLQFFRLAMKPPILHFATP